MSHPLTTELPKILEIKVVKTVINFDRDPCELVMAHTIVAYQVVFIVKLPPNSFNQSLFCK
jgi:hypothetical protein